MLGHRSKTIIAIVAVILIISGCYLFFFVNQQKQNRHLLISSKKELVSTLVTTLTRQIDRQYTARLKSFIAHQKEPIQAFISGDREKLYSVTLPVFQVLKSENVFFEHILFIQADGTVFLRMHEPERFGDRFEHEIIRSGENEARDTVLSGFGECGLYYRVSQPVYNQDRLVGIVLFRIHIVALIEEIQKNLGMHSALNLGNGENIGRENLDTCITSGGKTLYHHNDPFFAKIAGELKLSDTEQLIKDNDTVFDVFPSYTIRDNQGRQLGEIIQALDVTEIEKSDRHDLYRLALVTLTVLVVASIILYLSFEKLLGQLLVLNETLNRRNEELSMAGKQLENLVEERTAKLAATNRQLEQEIIKRQDANRYLSRSVEEWQSTFDAIADPVTILDNDFEIVIANKAANTLLIHNNEESVGRKCYELFAGRSTRCSTCPASEVFRSGSKQVEEIEHKYLGRTLLVSCAPIMDGSESMGFVHTARDITQEKELKKQLFQAQKMEAIATLAGGIAHDFNNILGAILGNADLLLYRLASQAKEKNSSESTGLTLDDVASHLEAIKKAGNRAKELVSQILAFSRQGQSQRQNADITPVIKEGIKLLRSSLPANIEIQTTVDSECCQVYADLTQVHQVFMNLCTNAAQAMSEKGGVLSISLSLFENDQPGGNRFSDLQRGRYVALEVKDTGHGMSPAVMERIYDPFFTTRDVSVGTGMGLAVIHGIVSAHNGVLDVQSEEGKGSVFTLFLPCVKDVRERSDDVILGVPRGSGEKILFVDDEEDIVRMTTRMLEYLGYIVYPATKGEQALAMLTRKSFEVDLIITDYSMPGVSGVELARELAELQRDIPVMLCSGFSESVVLDEDARSVIRTFMSKPLDMKKLAIAIREVLTTPAGDNNAGSDN